MATAILSSETHTQRITVKEALEKYREHCRQPVPFLDLVKGMICDGSKTDFNNDSYFDALFLTELMFDKAERNVSILTGSGFDGFFSALELPFNRMVQKVKEVGGVIKVILLNSKPCSLLDGIAAQHPNNVKVIYAYAAAGVGHFTVCDGKIVRAEEIHGDITESSFADEIKAKVSFDDGVRGKALEGFFGQLWGKLHAKS